MDSYISDNEVAILVIVFTFLFTLLINLIIFFRKRNETNKKTDIIKLLIEKNPDIDIEDILKKLNPPSKSLKSKLMGNFKTACILIAIGVGIFILGFGTDNIEVGSCIGGLMILLGLAYYFTYRVSKKTMQKELEAEEKQTIENINKGQK